LLRKVRDFKNASNRDFILKMLSKQSVCAEIGVSRGKFSKRILKIIKPSKLYLIDPWSVSGYTNYQLQNHATTQKTFDKNFANVTKTFLKYDNVLILRGKSKDVLNTFSDSFFDWVYIDGSHFYDDVLSDLEISRKKVKPDGMIVGDDYIEKKHQWKDDVKRAVNDFAKKHNLMIKSFGSQFMIKNTKGIKCD